MFKVDVYAHNVNSYSLHCIMIYGQCNEKIKGLVVTQLDESSAQSKAVTKGGGAKKVVNRDTNMSKVVKPANSFMNKSKTVMDSVNNYVKRARDVANGNANAVVKQTVNISEVANDVKVAVSRLEKGKNVMKVVKKEDEIDDSYIVSQSMNKRS